MTEDYEYLLKICCLGSVDNQKRKFIRRFAENKFDTNYLPPLGVDITTKKITVDGIDLKLILVDAAGQVFFGKLRPSYYRGASALIIFFSKGDRESFHMVTKWKREFEKYISTPIPRALVGFQSERKEVEEVTSEEAETLAHDLNATYFDCHPKRGGSEVEEIMQFLSRKVISPKLGKGS
jgi:small GTP-binding protein